jgi:hypothetical protein
MLVARIAFLDFSISVLSFWGLKTSRTGLGFEFGIRLKVTNSKPSHRFRRETANDLMLRGHR